MLALDEPLNFLKVDVFDLKEKSHMTNLTSGDRQGSNPPTFYFQSHYLLQLIMLFSIFLVRATYSET